MKLRVLRGYRNKRLSFRPNTVVEVRDEIGKWLLENVPDAFEEIIEPQVIKDTEQPPVDKMMRHAPRRK